MLPSPAVLTASRREGRPRAAQASGSSALDYAATLAAWRERFHEAWPQLAPLGFDERFRRMWDYYLAYCEAGFRSGNIDVRQIVYTKPA